MFATQTMLASTILTDAILFNHKEQEYKMYECNKLSMELQVSNHKKLEEDCF